MYKNSDWNVICDVCGKKIKHSQSRRTWDNLLVCQNDWDPKHPQLYKTPLIKDVKPLPKGEVRTRPTDTFVNGETSSPKSVWGSTKGLTWGNISSSWGDGIYYPW